MTFVNNLRTFSKLISGFGILIFLMIVIALLGGKGITDIRSNLDSMYSRQQMVYDKIDEMNDGLSQIRGDIYQFIAIPEDTTVISDYKSATYKIDSILDYLATQKLTAEETTLINQFTEQWPEYKTAASEVMRFISNGDKSSAQKSLAVNGRLSSIGLKLTATISDLNVLSAKQAQLSYDSAVDTHQKTLIILIGGCIICLVMAVLIVYTITDSINKPMSAVLGALNTLKQGSITLVVTNDKLRNQLLTRKDEFGELARGVLTSRKYLTEMSEIADAIAKNNLAINVQPKNSDDKLGNTLLQMVQNLNTTLAEVAEASRRVQEASMQLANASHESGLATSQISTTIQQVAAGTTQQSEAISRTASSIEQMGRAIDGVAKGAEEQASATARAFALTNQLSDAIKQVTGNIDQMVQGSTGAADAARRGYETVNQTLAGMQSIKTAVDLSANKVQEMGSRSDQIGDIVTTIEDIASQTNLLALNAAIEAARAGEAGKGFSVVADEVRKLAERSSSSTREIADLVKDIQQTVSEAVEAMIKGSKEVDAGVLLANQSGAALQEILTSNETVSIQAREAAIAAENMAKSASELVSAVESVSSVVEQNTAATEEMAAGSNEVTQAIENIASVSEQNSAAVEEVSASAEEMSAQVQEVSTSAKRLSTLANQLSGIVERFQLA